jgi:hypothetical protein
MNFKKVEGGGNFLPTSINLVIIAAVNILAVKVVRSVGHADDRLIDRSIIYAVSPRLAIQFISFSSLSFVLGQKIFFLSFHKVVAISDD